MKLYHAIRPSIETMFVSGKTGDSLEKEAQYFLDEEKRVSNKQSYPVKLIEVTSIFDIPESWRNGLLWNVDGELTAQQYLTEYQEYLRLKAKFG